jgi:hypothetical protein
VREADPLISKASQAAWLKIGEQIRAIEAEQKQTTEIVSVAMDTLPGDSIIEELPETPKSSRPGAVPVRVRLRVTYRFQ